MEPNELRIGNYITFDEFDDIETVKSIYRKKNEYYIDGINIQFIKPIPLTEDWLLKMGFQNISDKLNNLYSLDLFINNGAIGFYANNEDNFTDVYVYAEQSQEADQVKLCDNLIYVHQLQNLYFALTGTELTINT